MEENVKFQKIDLQSKTTAKEGVIEIFEFEKEDIGLKKTVFHRMFIPLEPFTLNPETKPIETKIFIDWLNLNLKSATNLDGLNLKTTAKDDSQIKIHLDNIDNPCDIDTMRIKKIETDLYQIDCELFVEFEYEKVAQNETFHFKTMMKLNPEIHTQTN